MEKHKCEIFSPPYPPPSINLIKTNSPGGSLLIVFTKSVHIIHGRISDNKDMFVLEAYLRYIYKMAYILSLSFSTDPNKKCTLSSWMKSFRINDLQICRILSVRKNIINFLSLLTKNTIFKEFWVRVVIFFIHSTTFYWISISVMHHARSQGYIIVQINRILVLLTLLV